jgi:hypothetical protein
MASRDAKLCRYAGEREIAKPPPILAVHHERETQLGIAAVSAQVDDEQRDQREALELCLELALALGFTEPCDPCSRGRELHTLACRPIQ